MAEAVREDDNYANLFEHCLPLQQPLLLLLQLRFFATKFLFLRLQGAKLMCDELLLLELRQNSSRFMHFQLCECGK